MHECGRPARRHAFIDATSRAVSRVVGESASRRVGESASRRVGVSTYRRIGVSTYRQGGSLMRIHAHAG
ncbi:hypothetical protein ABD05_28175 [Burkholderia pyrrocinia]|nr:hypothetical protein ABD05_28175 [Burkholderia pyrrocinia]